jgi:hypothetical protein
MTTRCVFAQNKRPLVKLSPLAAIDVFNFPAVQVGFEFSITPRVSWYNEVGFRYGSSMYDKIDTPFLAAKGFKAKTEVRYYFRRLAGTDHSNRLEGYYMAINLFYVRDVHNASATYYYQKDSSIKKQR